MQTHCRHAHTAGVHLYATHEFYHLHSAYDELDEAHCIHVHTCLWRQCKAIHKKRGGDSGGNFTLLIACVIGPGDVTCAKQADEGSELNGMSYSHRGDDRQSCVKGHIGIRKLQVANMANIN